MRILVIILILIANFGFGQGKVTIGKNIKEYEIKDEYNRFDDVTSKQIGFNKLVIEFLSDSLIVISNNYSTGFTGQTVTFKIDQELNIVKVSYNYYTDVINFPVKYKVVGIDLKLNQNPFSNLKEFRGLYVMQIQKFDLDGSLLQTFEFKGKFKTYKEISENSVDYKWAKNQNKQFYGITNNDGIYFRPDKIASLKSDYKILINEIKKLKEKKPKRIKIFAIVNEKGKIEEQPIKILGQLNKDLENKIIKLLIELTEWYPGCVDGKEVKSQIPLIIKME
ncbi:hypothetical protein [Winogradskyella wichelsiae]|uniref:hypothetical protein n=1 Tax=Winogradskyella wichelsiae TaxID=2697007 RepID=UPI003EF42878